MKKIFKCTVDLLNCEPARFEFLQILSECLTISMTSSYNVMVNSPLGNETQGVQAAMKVA